jgi:hypothetical protein
MSSTDNNLNEFIAASSVIAILGTISNSLLLSYFITTSKSTNFQADSLINKLFRFLNIFDLLVILSMALQLCTHLTDHYAGLIFYKLFYGIFMASVFATGFLTCLLAIIRAINFISPLTLIYWRLVKGSIVVYSLLTVVLQSLLIYFDSVHNDSIWVKLDDIQFVILAGMFLVVAVSNVLAMGKLHFSRTHSHTWRMKRQAFVTVGLLSLLYCVCNIGFIIIEGLPTMSKLMIPLDLRNTARYILLPLNSACNPTVYLLRKAAMRSYLKNLLAKLYTCKKTDEVQNFVQKDKGTML